MLVDACSAGVVQMMRRRRRRFTANAVGGRYGRRLRLTPLLHDLLQLLPHLRSRLLTVSDAQRVLLVLCNQR